MHILPAAVLWCLPGGAVAAEVVLPDTGGRAIIVDGKLTEWPAALRFELRDAAQVTSGAERWAGPTSLSGEVLVTYDAEALYVGARVTRLASLGAEGGDSVEVLVNLDSPGPHDAPGPGDWHLQLPATGPSAQVYLATRQEAAEGASLVTRPTAEGYVLEAAIPLRALPGTVVRPSGHFAAEVVLTARGAAGGGSPLQLTASGSPLWTWATAWRSGRLGGAFELHVPDPDGVGSAWDGTEGARLLHRSRVLRGRVRDATGAGVPDVRVATWPRSAEAVTDAEGRFVLHEAVVYDRSVVTIRKDGWYSTLAAWDDLANLHLEPAPDLTHRVSPLLYGHNYWMWRGSSPVDRALPLVAGLGLRMVRFGGTAAEDIPDEAYGAPFARFLAFTRSLGAEPYVQVPVRNGSPARSAALVRRAIEEGWRVKYWTVGNEPDLVRSMSAVRYANLVREHVIAMKRVDPTILVAAGELSWRYQGASDDWVSPLVRLNADVLNFVSIHRYLSHREAEQTVENVLAASDATAGVLRQVQERVERASDVHLPVIITEANVGATGDPNVPQGPAGSATFWGGYTLAQLYGAALREGVPTVQPWSLAEGWTLGAIDEHGPKPSFYGVQMVARNLGDLRADDVVADHAGLRVYGTRHSADGSWAVLVLNPAAAPVEAGLRLGDATVRRTYAARSITIVRATSDGSTRALMYTEAMAAARQAPAWEPG